MVVLGKVKDLLQASIRSVGFPGLSWIMSCITNPLERSLLTSIMTRKYYDSIWYLDLNFSPKSIHFAVVGLDVSEHLIQPVVDVGACQLIVERVIVADLGKKCETCQPINTYSFHLTKSIYAP